MSIQFGAIHNLVRTYQRVLNLDPAGPASSDHPGSDADDRVSISPEARKLQQGGKAIVAEGGPADAPPAPTPGPEASSPRR